MAVHLDAALLRWRRAWPETLARISQGDLGYARELAAHPVVRGTSPPADLLGPLGPQRKSPGFHGDAGRHPGPGGGPRGDRGRRGGGRRAQDLEWAPDARARARIDKAFDQKAKREKRRALTVGLDEVMDVFASWYRDLAVVALDAGDAVLNTDHLDDLQEDALPGMVDAYLAAVAAVHRAQERFRYNVDARCALEDMVFTMKEALS